MPRNGNLQQETTNTTKKKKKNPTKKPKKGGKKNLRGLCQVKKEGGVPK